MCQYLHARTVGFAADQSCGDVCVSELIVQVDHVRHPAGQEELVPLHLTRPEHHAVDVSTWGGGFILYDDFLSENITTCFLCLKTEIRRL